METLARTTDLIMSCPVVAEQRTWEYEMYNVQVVYVYKGMKDREAETKGLTGATRSTGKTLNPKPKHRLQGCAFVC